MELNLVFSAAVLKCVYNRVLSRLHLTWVPAALTLPPVPAPPRSHRQAELGRAIFYAVWEGGDYFWSTEEKSAAPWAAFSGCLCSLWSLTSWVLILALPPAVFTSLPFGKLLNLSVPQCLHL